MKNRFLIRIVSVIFPATLVAQGGTPGNVSTGSATQFLGYDNTGVSAPLLIRNDFNGAPIWFFTGGVLPTDKRMVIRGNVGPFAGFVGIGNNFNGPLNLLDVRNGDINIGAGNLGNVPNSPQAYKIGGNQVLWLGAVPFTSNILCGVGAGASLNGGTQNTLMGNLAGTNLTIGGGNTAFGFEALRDNVNTASNVAIGWRALQRNLVQQNTAVGTEAMRFNQTAFQNTAVGCEALRNNVDGIQNVAIGYQSLKFTTGNQITGVGQENTACGNQVLTSNQLGSRNSGFGDDVLYNNQGNCNTGIGSEALSFNTNGNANTGVGQQAAVNNRNGNWNTAIGDSVLYFNRNGDQNTVSGAYAGFGVPNNSHSRNSFYGFESDFSITVGHDNVFGGYRSGFSNKAGNMNTGVGADVMYDNVNGSRNSALGDSALKSNTRGNDNTAAGYKAGFKNITGSRNTTIGANADMGGPVGSATSLINAAAIGSDAIVTKSHKMILGNDTVMVGIGLSNDVNTPGFFGPNNKLEINTDLGTLTPHDPSPGGALGKSGLRFRDLHAGGVNYQSVAILENLTQPNPFSTPAVLSVDVNGDVILVPDAVGPGGGSITGADNGCSTNGPSSSTLVHLGNKLIVSGGSGGKLLDDREIPMNNFSLLFSDPSYASTTFPLASNTFSFGRLNTVQTVANPKMYTQTETERVSGMFVTDASLGGSSGFSNTHIVNPVTTSFAFNQTGPTGLVGYVYGSTAPITVKSGVVGIADGLTAGGALGQSLYGVYGQAAGNTTASNVNAVGVRGSSPYANISSNIGGLFDARNCTAANSGIQTIASGPATINTGIGTQATGATTNYGVYSTATSTGATDNYGVFGWAQGATNNYAVYGTTISNSNYAGYFNGNLVVTNGTWPSDSTLKTNVQNIPNALATINQLKPKTFYFDTTNSFGINLSNQKQYGFLAQNVNQVLPELVRQVTHPADSTHPAHNYLGLNYNAFIGLLTAGVQQQQQQIDSLRTTSIGGIRDTLRTGIIQVVSDANFKTNIDSINNASAIVSQLKPRSFYFDTANAMSSYHLKLNNQKQYGLIAQDVQTVLPELVGNTHRPAQYDATGNQIAPAVDFKNLNYNAFIALLIKSNQELQQRVTALENAVSSCCSNGARTTNNSNKNTIEVELSDADIVVLNQNQPNPFAEQTTITYQIPQNTGFAQILFYDINGRQIKAVDISKKGKGQLNVFANDLSNGVYSYTLVIDGKIIETKKMIKQQ